MPPVRRDNEAHEKLQEAPGGQAQQQHIQPLLWLLWKGVRNEEQPEHASVLLSQRAVPCRQRKSCWLYPIKPMCSFMENLLERYVFFQALLGVSDISEKNYRMPINWHLSNYRQNYRYRKIENLKLSKNYRYRKMHKIWSDKFIES